MTVNQRIKNELTIRGWSQYQLAKYTQIEQSTISKWFQPVPTTPSAASLKKVAKAFDISLGELLTEQKAPDLLTQELNNYWRRLSENEKIVVLDMIKTIVAHR